MRRQWTFYVLFPILALSQPSLAVTTEVIQEVAITNGQTTINEIHRWSLLESGFRLNIESTNRTVDYIFNGRNLFACIRQTQELPGTNELSEKLARGVCLTLPPDIVLSFLISPHSSMNILDLSDSLQITLSLNKHTVENHGKTGQPNTKTCDQRKRQLSFTFVSSSTKQMKTNIGSEETCVADDLNWRKQLYRSLARTLVQQAAGRALRSELDAAKITELGFEISKNANYKITHNDKSYQINVGVKLQKVSTIKDDDKLLHLPLAYLNINESLKPRSATKADKKKDKGEESKGPLSDPEMIIPTLLRSFMIIPIL